MKKTYINPVAKYLSVEEESILAASGVTSNNGIEYGGVDTEGTLDPSVKENVFEDSPF